MTHSYPFPAARVASDPGLVLVTSPGCHLCAHARSVVAGLSLPAREIDAGSAEAQDLAGRGVPLAFLPVLSDGKRVLAYGRFSARRLQRELGL
jgi:hypothetical protein